MSSMMTTSSHTVRSFEPARIARIVLICKINLLQPLLKSLHRKTRAPSIHKNLKTFWEDKYDQEEGK